MGGWRFSARAFLCAIPLALSPAYAQAADPLADAAGVYASYRADVADLGAASLSAPGDVERALDRLGRYSAEDLTRGWVAYGALSAMRSPAFNAGIDSVEKRYGRAAVISALRADPAYPGRRAGYGEAISFILDAAYADLRTARANAARIDAISSQSVPWSDGLDGDTRGARLRVLAAAPFSPPPAHAAAPAPSAPDATLASNRVLLARRMTTLAALRMLGASGEARMLDDKPTRECVNLQLLQFRQCVSVTRDASEGAQCMGEHALRGVNSCLNDALIR